jgi:hypothetical protein
MKNILLTMTMLAGLSACAIDSIAMSEYEKKLQWVKQADAELDAKAALAKGDFRLLAMAQRGMFIPGVDQDLTAQYELKCGIRLVDGYTDAVRGEEHLRLLKMAHTYALHYNEIIKTSCKP